MLVKEKDIIFSPNGETHGFKKYFEYDVPGVPDLEKVVYLQLGDTVLEFEYWTNEKENRGYHFCLISDDFDSDNQKLRLEKCCFSGS